MRETETEDERERRRGEKNREGEGRKRDSHKRLQKKKKKNPQNKKKPLCLSLTLYRHTNRNIWTRLHLFNRKVWRSVQISSCTSSSFSKSANTPRACAQLTSPYQERGLGFFFLILISEVLYPVLVAQVSPFFM